MIAARVGISFLFTARTVAVAIDFVAILLMKNFFPRISQFHSKISLFAWLIVAKYLKRARNFFVDFYKRGKEASQLFIDKKKNIVKKCRNNRN